MSRIICIMAILLIMAGNNTAEGKGATMRPYPGGRCYMMRLALRDKAHSICSLECPQDFLSAKAIERRRRQNLQIDSTDLPISPVYINMIKGSGMEIVTQSKWNNTVVVKSKSMQALRTVAKMPFVRSSCIVWKSPDSIADRKQALNIREQRSSMTETESASEYGMTEEQVKMLGGETLHGRRYHGEGMTIAVLDGGFMNVDRIKAFKDVRIVGTADFVHPKSKNIFRELDHGTKVLSAMAVNIPGYYKGTAPNAGYWLLRCEDGETEQLVEEDYWAAAAEYADSVGVDIISSSLGYHVFDHKEMSHKYKDLDGEKSVCSHAASLLASKGIVMVSSAGNDGMDSWKKISVPADAKNIITVGAVTPQRTNAAFSSIGPTADGRVKPDVMAAGSPAAVITGRGTMLNDMGTSFAAPQIAGLVACLWQSMPQKTALEIIDTVRQIGDNAENPDNIYGYGIPDFSRKR